MLTSRVIVGKKSRRSRMLLTAWQGRRGAGMVVSSTWTVCISTRRETELKPLKTTGTAVSASLSMPTKPRRPSLNLRDRDLLLRFRLLLFSNNNHNRSKHHLLMSLNLKLLRLIPHSVKMWPARRALTLSPKPSSQTASTTYRTWWPPTTIALSSRRKKLSGYCYTLSVPWQFSALTMAPPRKKRTIYFEIEYMSFNLAITSTSAHITVLVVY